MIDYAENRKKNNVALWWIFVIIFLTDSLLFATNAQTIFMYAKRFGVIGLTIVIFIRYAYRRNWTLARDAKPLLAITFSIVISMLLNGMSYSIYSYITMVFTLWFGYLYSKEYSLQEFCDYYCKVMCAIAAISLVCYLARNSVASMSFLPSITNKAGYIYKTVFFTNIPLRETLRRRNGGPFWEPGVYQTYLNIALMLTLFVKQNKNKIFYIVIFLVTVLTTLSGAALIPMILIIAAYFFENHNMKSFAAVCCLLCLVAVLMNTGMFNEIIMKMSNAEGTTSFGYRISSIYGNLKGFLHNPLFGSNPEVLNNIRAEYLSVYVGNVAGGSTNTYLTYLSLYGIFVGCFMFFNLYKCVKSFTRTKIAALFLFFAVILMTSNENLTASLLICTVTFLRYKDNEDIITL